MANRDGQDIALFVFMTGGLMLPVIVGVYLYVYVRGLIRRYVKRKPDWEDF